MVARFEVRPALGRQLSASFGRRSRAQRAAGWLLAVLGPVVLTAVCLPFRSQLGVAGFLFLALLIVVAAAITGGTWPAIAGVLVGFATGAFFFAVPYESFTVDPRLHNVPLVAFVIVGLALAVLVRTLAALAEEQADLRQVETALRRVATLVARGVPDEDLFAAAAREVRELLGARGPG
jgi:two-component system sensor histidine kinase KdpD